MEMMGDLSRNNPRESINQMKGNEPNNKSTEKGELLFSIHTVSTNSAVQKLLKRLTNGVDPVKMDVDYPQSTSFHGLEVLSVFLKIQILRK